MHSPNFDSDVLIIGGGPAGCAAATRLAQAGTRVRILERPPQPGLRIGESLLPASNAFFQQLGVWDAIEAAGFIRKYGAEFETADGSRRVENVFAKGLKARFEYTYQVERPRFDEILLQHAAESGCVVERGVNVIGLTDSGSHFTLAASDGREWTARWLLDASGRSRFLGRKLNLATDPCPTPARIAVYNHFQNFRRRPGREAGNIIITRRRDGWFWQIPISDEMTSVGLVGLASELRESKLKPETWFQHNLTRSPAVAARMTDAVPAASFQTTADYTYTYASFAGPRYFLLGDAATFSDPIFSSGIYLGLESGINAAKALLKADARSRSLSLSEQSAYTRDFKRSTKIIRDLIDTFYDDGGFSVFMNPTEKFLLFPAVNSIVAGNTRPGFSIRWRYALFRMICRLNKNHRLVAPVLGES